MAEWGGEEQLLAFARDVEGYLNEVYSGGRRRPEEWCDLLGEVKRARVASKGEGASVSEGTGGC